MKMPHQLLILIVITLTCLCHLLLLQDQIIMVLLTIKSGQPT